MKLLTKYLKPNEYHVGSYELIEENNSKFRCNNCGKEIYCRNFKDIEKIFKFCMPCFNEWNFGGKYGRPIAHKD